jgi:uncharacterized hydrophobic protein (TIGR00271 family)
MAISVDENDLDRMQDALLFTREPVQARLTKFWGLLVLSAIIATAGVVSDSTATVIGAMIVAPLMVPILGTAFSIVLSSRRDLLVSAGLVVAGVLCVIVVAYLFGMIMRFPITPDTNTQVAGRVNPTLVDLVAALATGTVGAFALVRRDIGDTLPGVAIAISLVPPLAVVGLELEAREFGHAGGALLLFLTNVAAILVTGVLVFLLYGVRGTALRVGQAPEMSLNRGIVVIIVFAVMIVVPLVAGTARVATDNRDTATSSKVIDDWVAGSNWEVVELKVNGPILNATLVGNDDELSPADLRARLDASGLEALSAEVRYVLDNRETIPASQ